VFDEDQMGRAIERAVSYVARECAGSVTFVTSFITLVAADYAANNKRFV
jgi:hypothetical protein